MDERKVQQRENWMPTLMGKAVDKQNIALAKLLKGLRHDLDIYCLISVNADSIINSGVGKRFFGHLQRRSIENISLSICKSYEYEGRYELNSIGGILRYLNKHCPIIINEFELTKFIQKYDGPFEIDDKISALNRTFNIFRNEYKSEFKQFEDFRNKNVAHTEYNMIFKSLPSYYIMEKLFDFAVDFYELVSRAFVNVSPANLRVPMEIKSSLVTLFKKLGIKDIKENMQ